MKRELNELNEIEKERERKLEELQIQYNKKQNYNQRIIIEMKKLDELETPEVNYLFYSKLMIKEYKTPSNVKIISFFK